MNIEFLNTITCGDCRELLPQIEPESIHLFLSDIPYGINLDSWDVLHHNTNSALLGRLKDVLAWKKNAAFHRAQRLNIVLKNRGLTEQLALWEGWRLGNLAPIYEPIAWFFKPYKITITDNILQHGVGAINTEACKINGVNPTNLLEFGFVDNEKRFHEAQKPLALIEFLIKLTTQEEQTTLDRFAGSDTTAVASKNLKRNFIAFENNPLYCQMAQNRLQEDKTFKMNNVNIQQSNLFV